MLIHMCSYNMPLVGQGRIMVISLACGYTVVVHGPRLLLGDEYPRVVTVRERRKWRVNVHRTTPYRVIPYRV
jgi:hypothetical protein